MKDILVLCDSNDSNAFRIETALCYAESFDAHITGVHMIPFPVIPIYGGMYPDASSYTAADQIDRANKHAKELEDSFTKIAESHHIQHEWKTIEGLDLNFIIENARYNDLVIAPATYSHYSVETSHQLCDYFTTRLGRPLLITPDLKKVFNLPKRIIIAWNESHEATRAVHDALPILRQAENIQIVNVSKSEKKEKENMKRCEQLQRHLKHHFINCEIFTPNKLLKGTGHTIYETALEYNADLIVMGAYGHSKFKEIVLGGTTKYLIENSTMPLFVSN
ncbi:MAG: universal stress protein [Gammaproteobacteria bacterium]|nr:universal stress protein [Gammaproteobacteria bacterium]